MILLTMLFSLSAASHPRNEPLSKAEVAEAGELQRWAGPCPVREGRALLASFVERHAGSADATTQALLGEVRLQIAHGFSFRADPIDAEPLLRENIRRYSRETRDSFALIVAQSRVSLAQLRSVSPNEKRALYKQVIQSVRAGSREWLNLRIYALSELASLAQASDDAAMRMRREVEIESTRAKLSAYPPAPAPVICVGMGD